MLLSFRKQPQDPNPNTEILKVETLQNLVASEGIVDLDPWPYDILPAVSVDPADSNASCLFQLKSSFKVLP